MLRRLKNRVRDVLGLAIDWRVRDVLETERRATIELGQTFARGSAHITDQQRLLQQRVDELEKRLSELEKGR